MTSSLPAALEEVGARYPEIYCIVSPPRCSSTAFSRVFWEQPSVRFYSHEPFEVTYYQDSGLPEVVTRLAAPLDLARLTRSPCDAEARSLVIKEMPYQVGRRFPILAELATQPLVFLTRDPRLNISSRIRKKLEVGDNPIFPHRESGWQIVSDQIEYCRREGIAHLIVDSSDFRNSPEEVFPSLLEHLGLEYRPDTLSWRECPQVDLDNLDGKHRHLYREVLASRGVEPDLRPVPELSWFPREGGMRDHVAECLEIYEDLCAADERLAAN